MESKATKKLLKLLDEYCDGKGFWFVDHNAALNWFEILMDWKTEFLWDETIFSLRFWFIYWLFDKEEIDMKKCMEDEDFKTLMKYYEAPDCALMVLAVKYSNYILLLNRLKDD